MNVLVCITAQENSKRLIKAGFDKASANNGELYIIHVIKGQNIFDRENSVELIDSLFQYGKELGGIVHAVCADDVIQAIKTFANDYRITNIVLGESANNENFVNENAFGGIKNTLPNVDIFVLNRE